LPDYLLIFLLAIVALRQLAGGSLTALRDDFEWILAYVLGRLLLLDERQCARWSSAALVLVSFLALGSAYETFVLGPLPRQVLYAFLASDSKVPIAFSAEGYGRVRAAATMVGPAEFGAVCMVAILLWVTRWGTIRTFFAVVLPIFGLLLTVSRAAMLGLVIGLGVIALRRGVLVKYIGVVVAGSLIVLMLIPILGLTAYVSGTVAGSDTSLQGHQDTVQQGLQLLIQHPLGVGAGTVGPRAYLEDNALDIESAYLTIAAEYGVLAGVALLSFVVVCFLQLYSLKSDLGVAASAILAGFGASMLTVLPIHQSPHLAFWIWTPVGMGIAAAAKKRLDSSGNGIGDLGSGSPVPSVE